MTIQEIFPTEHSHTKYYITDTGLVLSTYVIEGSETLEIDGVVYSKRSMSTGIDGYPSVTVRHKKYPVHRLVAINFLDTPTNTDRKYVNHKDGDKSNNHIDNLEWVTASENIAHAIKLGLRKTNSQEFITRTVCSECDRPLYYNWCKTVEYDDRQVRYKVHGEPKIVKIKRRLDYMQD